MKPYFFILILLCILQTKATTYTLTFGKGENCSGFNICSISVNASTITPNQATVDITVKDGKLEFNFVKASLSDKAFLKFFSTGYFVIDADYHLPDDIATPLHLNGKIIKAGKYKVTATGDRYVVQF